MKRNHVLKSLMLCLMLVCVASADAQDLKSILSGVAKTVVGDKATTEVSIIGTWNYVAPDCQFESDNFLTKAGGEVGAAKVEEELKSIYAKVGADKCQYTFNEDGTYTSTFGKRTITGTYTFDSEAKTIEMKGKLGIKTTAHVAVMGNSMSLVFNADKLMGILKTVTGAASKINSTASTLNGVINQFDGMRLGFELKK